MMRTLGELLDLINRMIAAGAFIDLDDLLREVSIEEADSAYLCGCLRFTFPVRQVLPYWQTLLERTKEEYKKRGIPQRTLMGLDRTLNFCRPEKVSTRGRYGSDRPCDGKYLGRMPRVQ
jgi:hypothetical protein